MIFNTWLYMHVHILHGSIVLISKLPCTHTLTEVEFLHPHRYPPLPRFAA